MTAPTPPATATLELAGELLTLLPEKAAFLPAHRTLLVADAHLGKAVTFRRLGVPVPHGTTDDMLATLGALVERHAATRIVFLGDLLHSAHAHAPTTLAAVARWRERHAALALTLVRGNHDARAGDPPAAWGIEVVDEPHALDNLALCHHPDTPADGLVLAGHVHPCVRLAGRANDRLRLPCFWFGGRDGARFGVLPAFGAFTGMHAVEPAAGDRVYVVADGAVTAL